MSVFNQNMLGYNNNNTTTQPMQYQQYPYMQQQLNNQFLKCRPVSSKEEAMAFQIDLDGSLWVFPNVANGKIYTKQINNDGSASFGTYVFTEEKNNYNSNDYVTKQEFNQVVQKMMAAIGSSFAMNQSVENNNVNPPSSEKNNVPISF